MDQYTQIAGAILVLLGYLLSQLDKIDTSSNQYLIINLVGSVFLATAALWGQQWGFLVLNGTWALVSLFGLARKFTREESLDLPAR